MAGRKRKADARRQPGGRIDHSTERARRERAEDMTAVVLEARQRVYGVSAAVSKLMPETSFLGRLRAQNEISQRQYDAAMKYQKAEALYDSLHPVRGFPMAGNLDRGGSFDGREVDQDYIDRFRDAVKDHDKCERALASTAMEDAHSRQVTKQVVLKGYEMPAHIPTLRIGLNALAKALGVS